MLTRPSYCAALCFLLLHCAPAAAQTNSQATTEPSTYSLSMTSQRLVALAGPWRFQPGDNPAWSNPAFDDSHWALLPGDRPWPIDGVYKNLSGFAWYRFRVDVPAYAGPLAIELPRVYTSYQFFTDGVMIGSPSTLPLEEQEYRTVRQVYRLPSTGAAPHTFTFALRIWHWDSWASYYGGGPEGPVTIGDASLIERNATLQDANYAWSRVDSILLSVLETLAAFTALGLFFFRTEQKEYFWFSIMLFFSAAQRCSDVWFHRHVFWVGAGDDITTFLIAASSIGAAFFYLYLLKGRRNAFFWTVIATLAVNSTLEFPIFSRLTVAEVNAIGIVLTLPFSLWVIALLLRAARRGVADARLLLVPVLFQQTAFLAMSFLWFAYTAGWQTKYPYQDLPLAHWPFDFTLMDVTAILYLIAVLAILVFRFARTSREQDRALSDLEAARNLQHVLIPTELPAVPGFAVETAYRPAQEVGGDFFQIVPLNNRETLAVIGDVAGKGLPAAMTVSLLVGAVRSLAETTNSPAAILEGLNRRLIGRGASFTTTMVLRLSASGEVTLANAGHLAPYWNGREVFTDATLPLGLDEDAKFREETFHMRNEDRLTLMTDGIPEATCRRELFGFARTESLSTQPATIIADEAVRFGQSDDITVLSLVATA